MRLFAIRKHFLPWSFVGLFLAATGCDDKASRALDSQKQPTRNTVPFDCTQEDLVKEGGCWGQCEVNPKTPDKCKPRDINPPCKGLQPDDCLKQNKAGNTQCFLDFRGKAPQSNSNANPKNEDITVYYEPKCVHLSSASSDCRMKPLKEIDDECQKHASHQNDCHSVEVNGEQVCAFTAAIAPQAESCTPIDATLDALCARLGKNVAGGDMGGAPCRDIVVVKRTIDEVGEICARAVPGATVCSAAPGSADNPLTVFSTYCNDTYTAILTKAAGRTRLEGGNANEKKRRYCEGATSIFPNDDTIYHLVGTAICKFQEAKAGTPAQCRAKAQSTWTKDPCVGLSKDACKKADKVCKPESITLMPPELTQPTRSSNHTPIFRLR